MENFEWDPNKDRINQEKHSVSFEDAQDAFFDPNRLIIKDSSHSTTEETRYYCIGRVTGGVLTVRFTYRQKIIRIFGAGFWRKYKKLYFQQSEEA